MKEHYKKGGLGDVKCKKFLLAILEEKISVFRSERAKWESKLPDVYDILLSGTNKAKKVSDDTFMRVKKAMKMDYFVDKDNMIKEWSEMLSAKNALIK